MLDHPVWIYSREALSDGHLSHQPFFFTTWIFSLLQRSVTTPSRAMRGRDKTKLTSSCWSWGERMGVGLAMFKVRTLFLSLFPPHSLQMHTISYLLYVVCHTLKGPNNMSVFFHGCIYFLIKWVFVYVWLCLVSAYCYCCFSMYTVCTIWKFSVCMSNTTELRNPAILYPTMWCAQLHF